MEREEIKELFSYRKPATIAAIVLLILALFSWPYDYYVFLRWVVAGVAIFLTYLGYETKRQGWAVILAIIALLFNPLIPVHLDRETWQIIDLVVAGILAVSLHGLSDKIEKPIEEKQ